MTQSTTTAPDVTSYFSYEPPSADEQIAELEERLADTKRELRRAKRAGNERMSTYFAKVEADIKASLHRIRTEWI